jgi:hypothetical protein
MFISLTLVHLFVVRAAPYAGQASEDADAHARSYGAPDTLSPSVQTQHVAAAPALCPSSQRGMLAR